ncbi:winged helix-turn-helix transcriptional regulator [Rhodobacteraceae bacterium F11138]|nr:winged helix-turn-helix transcriptional regulator [Rhodobacteraceae bacterium F11138]
MQSTTLPPEPESDHRPLLPDYLLFQLAAASDAASAEFHVQVRQNGLRVPEYRALVCLHDEDGLMVTRLADLALMEQSRMTRVVLQMDEAGLVRRADDPRDRRRVRVYLTAKGRALARRMVAHARAHEASVLGLLPADDRDRLKSLLADLLDVLSAQT